MAKIGNLEELLDVAAASSVQYSGNGTNKSFTLPRGVSNAASIIVMVGNTVQIPVTQYSVTNTVLTFVTAPPTGTSNVTVFLPSTAIKDVFFGSPDGNPLVYLGDFEVNSTGYFKFPSGTTAQRPGTPSVGWARFNSDSGQYEGFDGTSWGPFGGARGGAGNSVFYENDTNVTSDYTITSGKNAMSAGPITINTGVTVTVPSGSTWTIV